MTLYKVVVYVVGSRLDIQPHTHSVEDYAVIKERQKIIISKKYNDEKTLISRKECHYFIVEQLMLCAFNAEKLMFWMDTKSTVKCV